MVNKPALERQWLHIQLLEGELYVFTDDGHWKDTMSKDWDAAIKTTFEALDNECYIGSVDDRGDLLIRIEMNPKILYGKFGMPYVERG